MNLAEYLQSLTLSDFVCFLHMFVIGLVAGKAWAIGDEE